MRKAQAIARKIDQQITRLYQELVRIDGLTQSGDTIGDRCDDLARDIEDRDDRGALRAIEQKVRSANAALRSTHDGMQELIWSLEEARDELETLSSSM